MKSRKPRDQDAYIREIEERLAYMEEERRHALEAVAQAIALGDFQPTVSGMAQDQAVLDDTLRRIRRLIPFQATAIYLVDEATQDFNLCATNPADTPVVGIERLINDGTFALALRERRLISTTCPDGRQAYLHVLATHDKISGMFAGLLDASAKAVYDTSLALFPLILLSSANALENIRLYKIIRKVNKDLRGAVMELAQSQSELEKRRRSLHEQVAERTTELTAAMSRLEAEIAHRRLIEVELKEARDRAEAGSRAKSEFLAVVSHEIRTPMNSIIGMTELIVEEPNAEIRKQYADMLINASDALLSLIDDILDFSKVESGRLSLEREPFSPVEVLTRTCGLFKHNAQSKGLDFRLDIAPDVPPIFHGDEVRFRQILVNLLGNALKFTDKGSISTSLAWTDQPQPGLLCRITDSGIGIPPDKIHVIFERFTQADSSTTRKYGGTGLGLAICHRLTQLMGGWVTAHSQPDAGTVMTFFIPSAPGACPVVSPPPVPKAARILFIDDSEDNRLLVAAYLKDSPYALDTAADGPSGLDMLRSRHYDLLLLDLEMPGQNGYHVARHVREWENRDGGPHLPILVLSAFAFPEDIAMSREAGCDAHLAKPLSRVTLLECLSQYLPIPDTPS